MAIEKLGVSSSNKTITISRLIKNIEQEKWDLNPQYQRTFKWSRQTQVELIKSILMGIPLPQFYVREKDGKFEVVDGKQKAITLYRFYKNKFGIDVGGRVISFNTMSQDERSDFLETELNVLYLGNIGDAETKKIFVQLQNGLRIKANQMRHAMGGMLIEAVQNIISETEFNKLKAFRSSDKIENESIVTRLFVLEHILNGKTEEDYVNDVIMDNMCTKYYETKVPAKITANVKDKIEIMKKAFGEEKSRLKPQMPFLCGTSCLITHLKENYTLMDGEIVAYLVDFAKKIETWRQAFKKATNGDSNISAEDTLNAMWYQHNFYNFGQSGPGGTVSITKEWFPKLLKKFMECYQKELKSKKKSVLTI